MAIRVRAVDNRMPTWPRVPRNSQISPSSIVEKKYWSLRVLFARFVIVATMASNIFFSFCFPTNTSIQTVGDLHTQTKPNQRKEEKAALLCLVVKDQNLRYIDEWADYHMALGFTGLRLYDNTEDFVMENWGIDKPYLSHIERIHFLPNITHKITEYKMNKTEVTKIQDTAYMDCVQSAMQRGIDWVAAFDEDEFLVLRNSSSVVEFMDEHCKYPCGQISFNTYRFGSANRSRYAPVPVTRRFQYRDESDDGAWVKAIVNPRAVAIKTDFWIHTFPLKSPWLWKDTSGRIIRARNKRWNMQTNRRNAKNPFDVAVLHHYSTLSVEEFQYRLDVRKDVNGLDRPRLYPDATAFKEFDDTTWQILRTLVPSYQVYDSVEDLGEDLSTKSSGLAVSQSEAIPARNNAAICSISKGSVQHVDEWVDYNLAIGFETIYIYDNSDSFELSDWHRKRFDTKTNAVEITHIPGAIQQLPAYKQCAESIQQRNSHAWIAFFDLDEFLVIKKHNSVSELLSTVSEKAGALTVNWLLFDFNDQVKYEPLPVTKRFQRREAKVNHHIKSIVRSSLLNTSDIRNPHNFFFIDAKATTVDTRGKAKRFAKWQNPRGPTDSAVLHHMNKKSVEEYMMRCERGAADTDTEVRDYELTNGTPTYCLNETAILKVFNDNAKNNEMVFDDSAWRILKERVPKYAIYDSVPTSISSLEEQALSSKETEKERGKRTKQKLWLVTCETRNNADLSTWWKTAKQVQKLADANSTKVLVKIKNICESKEWNGYLTKSHCMKDFLDGLLQEESSSGDLVMFTDSDTIFNAWSLSADQVLERYHRIRQGRDIVLSGEPACWIGRPCSVQDLALLYPGAKRSNCVQFLNSGQYIGTVQSLQSMVNTMLNMPLTLQDVPADTDQGLLTEQGVLTVWLSKNPSHAVLDYESSLFWSMMLGMVDSSQETGGDTCCGDLTGRLCGLKEMNRHMKRGATVNTSSLRIQMYPVPGCRLEIEPFSIHGNGPSFKRLQILSTRFQRLIRLEETRLEKT